MNMNLGMKYTSRRDTLLSSYTIVLAFCTNVSGRVGNIVLSTAISAVWVYWIYNMYAGGVRAEGAFGFTKKTFNIEKEQ